MAKRTGQARRGQKEKSSPVGAGLPGRKCDVINTSTLIIHLSDNKIKYI